MRKLLSVLEVLLVAAIMIPILLLSVSTVGSKAPPEKVPVIIGFKDCF